MRGPHRKGGNDSILAPSHAVFTREGEAEALTGVRAGRVLSRENKNATECRRCPYIRKAISGGSLA